jgi:hypothetical protein
VQTTATSLSLTQSSYIYSILDHAKMTGAKTVSTPIATFPVLSKDGGETMTEPLLYRIIVGALQYATITRPNIYVCCEQGITVYA